MKIIGLVGSPNGLKGNTGRLMLEVLKAAEDQGAEVEAITLPGSTVLPCRACNVCHRTGTCPQKDEFESIKKKIMDSNGVVLASPNYIFSVSAQMKAFMDRCAGVIHTTGFLGRYGAAVITSGAGLDEPVATYMHRFMTITGIRPVGAVWATARNLADGSIPDDIANKAEALGHKLVDWIANKKSTPEIDAEIKAGSKRMRELVEFRKDLWTYEYEYWNKKTVDD